MSRTYKATGINLQRQPIGEIDLIVTILTPEYGVIRAVVPGARKYKSSLRGKSEIFVVNKLLIAQGRSLDKITQAETLVTYPGLSSHLGKLIAAQYLGELTLYIGLSEQPQVELYELLNEHLKRIEKLTKPEDILPHLSQGIFHLLAMAGIGPKVQSRGNLTQKCEKIGFSFAGGGIIENQPEKINKYLTGVELSLLQKLGAKTLPPNFSIETSWPQVERLLREYTEYHLGRNLKTAGLIDSLTHQ